MRLAIAGFMHESNTFNPLKADRTAFAAQCLRFGTEFVEEWREAHHEMGGFIEGASQLGYELAPIGMAWHLASAALLLELEPVVALGDDGEVVELDDCAMASEDRPRRAAAVAAVRVFSIMG